MAEDRAWNDTLVEEKVTFHIELDEQLFLIENVPARINVETDEKHFLPETVERLQQVAWERCRPVRNIETLVYEYESVA